MHYWTRTFPACAMHMFDLDPSEERLVEHHGPGPEMHAWLVRENLDPAKLLYRSRPTKAFFTMDREMAKKMFARWG